MRPETRAEEGGRRHPKRTVAFYAITVLISLLLSILLMEVMLRNTDYITGSNMTRNFAVDRWMDKHWRVNELGYRDLLLSPRLPSPKPAIYFLGDSFTAGHGVDFADTFYYKTGYELEDSYNFFNISQPGLSTLNEYEEFSRFKRATHSRPHIAIHQYFINDIEDHISKPSWQAPAWLSLFSRHLESAQLIETLIFNLEYGQEYRRSLLNAYRNPGLLAEHENDLKALHQQIREDGGTVIFLVFPALNDDYMRETSFIIQDMRAFFANTCQPGDILIDATPSAQSLTESKRVASLLDDHPSPELHSLIAGQIIKAIRREGADGGRYKAYETCESLASARARGMAAPP